MENSKTMLQEIGKDGEKEHYQDLSTVFDARILEEEDFRITEKFRR